MLTWLFAGFCALIVVCVVIPSTKLFYYMIRDILWERKHLPPKKKK